MTLLVPSFSHYWHQEKYPADDSCTGAVWYVHPSSLTDVHTHHDVPKIIFNAEQRCLNDLHALRGPRCNCVIGGKLSLLPSFFKSVIFFTGCVKYNVCNLSKAGFSYPAKCLFGKSICIFTVSDKLTNMRAWIWLHVLRIAINPNCAPAEMFSCSIVTCGNAWVQNSACDF